MSRPQQSPLQRQIGRVSRRLFWQTFLARLLWCWAGALVVAAAWFVAQPYVLNAPPDWLRLAVAGGVLAAATMLAALLAYLHNPTRLTAALLMDEKFGLKERVTTSLTLPEAMHQSPAGQALLADVNQRVERLDMGERFPVRVSWRTTLAPLVACCLVAVAFFYQPPPPPVNANQQAKNDVVPDAVKSDIEKKLQKMRTPPKPRDDRPKSEELKRIEAELDQIANKPHETKDQLRERIKEMTALEDNLKQRERDMAERSQSIRNQLQQLEKWANESGSQEGPAKDLKKAIAEGDLQQAKEELKKLAKKIKDNELTSKEKEQLKRQIEDVQKKLERAAQLKEKQDELKKLREADKLSQEAYEREMKELKEQTDKLKDLQKLANQLGQAQKAMEKGDDNQASQSLSDAADEMKDIDLQDQDLQDLREQLQRLQDAKDGC